MFHLELRQFPHNGCRFNMSAAELARLLARWVRDRPVELAGRTWSPHSARITILEGPPLPGHVLSMGRGWRAAERAGHDVTERVLREAANDAVVASARAPIATEKPPPAADSPTDAEARGPVRAIADAEAQRLVGLLGDDHRALLETWRRVSARYPARSPSDRLALAEEELASMRRRPGGPDGH
jgi:hypothetical protein